jgi:hypothetical protein
MEHLAAGQAVAKAGGRTKDAEHGGRYHLERDRLFAGKFMVFGNRSRPK